MNDRKTRTHNPSTADDPVGDVPVCDDIIDLLFTRSEKGLTLLREKYPYMAMLGGINKNEIAKGREAIDRELERIRPLLGRPGYIPALDHLIPPEVSFEDYTYFVNRLRKMITGE